jgi:effector-binding domain-containing protein
MALEVQQTVVEAVPLAAVGGWTPLGQLSTAIRGRLDKVYAYLRAGGIAPLGHNVVVYKGARGAGPALELMIEVGVQTPAPIAGDGEMIATETPGGAVALAAHIGPYDGIAATGRAVEAQIAALGLKRAGVSWEVYGDWEEDTAKLRTDLYYLLGAAAR